MLRAIGRNDLKGSSRMHYLDLRNNRIRNIHPQAFIHLTLLRRVLWQHITFHEFEFEFEFLV
jgi:hypothetical protein